MLHNSGFEEKSALSQDLYITSNELEPTSSCRCFTEIAKYNLFSESKNEENSSLNNDSQHANTSDRKRQMRNKKMRKSQDSKVKTLSKRAHKRSSKRWNRVDFFFLITGHLAPGPGDESIVRIVLRAREMFSCYFFFI
ncbi:hypothetical protein AVEN_210160-1 [Araneus ventricosus]|uniref:Uncharacterized protein n=1 Tax=Araneus ventricosus TaxID=182803 RepID=A0A4Y2I4J3_ARAVE|nr:hypothetical protein AVEN_210160-1 [Araneus ventricosus]